MKLFSPLLLLSALSLVASLPSPDAEAEAEAIAIPDATVQERAIPDVTLEKRACETNGCECRKGTPQGRYCWACSAVTKAGDTSVHTGSVTGWVFECNPSGGCCAYGTRNSCVGGKKNPCG